MERWHADHSLSKPLDDTFLGLAGLRRAADDERDLSSG
jgi:hypothetical protein